MMDLMTARAHHLLALLVFLMTAAGTPARASEAPKCEGLAAISVQEKFGAHFVEGGKEVNTLQRVACRDEQAPMRKVCDIDMVPLDNRAQIIHQYEVVMDSGCDTLIHVLYKVYEPTEI